MRATRRSAPRPRSATATTGNSRPLAAWTVITRTPSWPSTRTAAMPSRSSRRVRSWAKSRKPRRSRPSCSSYSPPAASACAGSPCDARRSAARGCDEVVVEGRDRSVEQARRAGSSGASARSCASVGRNCAQSPGVGRRASPRATRSPRRRSGHTWPGLPSGSRAACRRSQSASGLTAARRRAQARRRGARRRAGSRSRRGAAGQSSTCCCDQ